ncbi:hypothetical protein M758_UG218500, partial [Ceratodon purpureus]
QNLSKPRCLGVEWETRSDECEPHAQAAAQRTTHNNPKCLHTNWRGEESGKRTHEEWALKRELDLEKTMMETRIVSHVV